MNYKIVSQQRLKVRSGPGVEYEEEAEPLNPGDIVIGAERQEESSKWIPIELEDESIGWVSRQYVVVVDEDYRVIETATVNEVLMQNQLVSKFGYPKEGASYLKVIDLREFSSQLTQVKGFEGNQWGCRIYGHKLLESPLKKAFELLRGQGLIGELRTYDGCFNIRKMTSGKSYSVHSWGLAVDFNAALNPYGGDIDFSDDFILCFAKAGFEAGALWSTPDGMHFQIPWTQDWRESSNPLRPRV
jgi:hypothetical protein